MQSTQSPIKHRKVFYIPGFDPFPARRYRELYRKQSQIQAAISRYRITQSAPVSPRDRFGWSVHGVFARQQVDSDFTVLEWSDLVKSSMSNGIFATYRQMLNTAWIYIITGALIDIMRLRRGPVLAALYPIAMLVLQLALAIAMAYAVVSGLHPRIGVLSWGAMGLVWPILVLFQRLDGRLYAYYLMHDYAHTAQGRGAYDPALQQRMDEFRADIERALSDPKWDEVLVVGHSSGAHLGISVLAQIIRSHRGNGRLSFLSLGHVVPMVTYLPQAGQLRADLYDLSRSDQLMWVDVTAPGDACSFALCDPVAVSGQGGDDQKWPLVLSAAFRNTLSQQRRSYLRFRFFQRHFQYLCAFDNPRGYDYFEITAGPVALCDYFADRRPSRQRITRAATRYTDRGA